MNDLPSLEALTPALRRASRPAIYLCVTPNRCALDDAVYAARVLIRRAGRAATTVDGLDDAVAGAILVGMVDDATPAGRKVAFSRFNLMRDRLTRQGISVLLCLLDVDLPLFADAAPDLWSVRTRIVRHETWFPSRGELPPIEPGGTAPLDPRFVEGTTPHLMVELLSESGVERAAEVWEWFYIEPRGGAFEALSRQRLGAIVGGADTGKTTLLLRFARYLARAGREVVMLRARRLDGFAFDGSDLDSALGRLCALCTWAPSPESRPWLLLDGFEWNGIDHMKQVWRVCADLVRADRVEGVVLTENPRRAVVHDAIRLDGFDAAQITEYIQAWASALDREAERIRYALRLDEPEMARFYASPLYLAMAVFLAVGERPARYATPLDLVGGVIRLLIERTGARTGGVIADAHERTARRLAMDLAWHPHGYENRPASLGQCRPPPPEDTARLRLETSLILEETRPGEPPIRFVHPIIADALYVQGVLEMAVDGTPDVLLDSLLRPGRVSSVGGLMFGWLAHHTPQRVGAVLDSLFEGREPPQRFLKRVRIFRFGMPLATLRAMGFDIHRAADAIFELNRDRVAVERDPAIGWQTGDLLLAFDDERLGRLEYVPITPSWSLARWPFSERDFMRFVRATKQKRLYVSSASSREAVTHIEPGLARSIVEWWRTFIDPMVRLPPLSIWSAAAESAPEWVTVPRSLGRPYLGAAVHLGSAEGVEDLGGVVRQWLIDDETGRMCSAGYGWDEEPRALRDSIVRGDVTDPDGSWAHFGLRLARYHPPD